MAFSYERYDRQQRRSRTPVSQGSALSYWLPLGLTVATATIGFATWIWNERRSGNGDDDDRGYSDDDDDRNASRRKAARSDEKRSTTQTSVSLGSTAPGYQDETAESREVGAQVEQDSIVTRMSGAIRRSPSPQQIFDGASKRVAAGVAAAGAIVGRSLTAIRESDDDFQDHERWSNEGEARQESSAARDTVETIGQTSTRSTPTQASSRRRTVAVVVSAEQNTSDWQGSGQGYEVEHASILSHLPQDINMDNVDLAILIYAPHLQSYPLHVPASFRNKSRADSSTASSYSNISTPAADDDTVLDLGPGDSNPSNALYDSLQMSALRLVPHPTQVLPFTTPTGHVHLLRHLSPSLVYIEEPLTGVDGEHVREIESWVGQIVVVVGGGGLVDTETEDEGAGGAADKGWWKDSNRVGLGKAEIVDSTRVTEDWVKRLG